MLKNQHFYNRTIRKIVVSFGTLFNDIVLVRYNKAGTQEYERTRVPLSYGAKEKYIQRLTQDPDLIKSIATALPRMSFDLQGLTYDSTRKQQSMIKNFAVNTSNHTLNSQYAPIPYNFDFSLSIYVRNQEDGTQILEQILPFFTPDFTVTVDLIPAMDQKYDIPIILNSVSPEVDYEGDMLSTRMIIWNLNFTVKGYIFPPVNVSGKIIEKANTNIYIDTQKRDVQKVFVDYANGSGVFTTNEVVRVVDRGITGKVTYFSNNATGTLIVEDLSELLEENDVLQGDYSNAIYTIDTVDLTPVKAVAIVTTTNPENANVDSDFGFAETITEYPQTILDFSNIGTLLTEDGDFLTTEDSEPLTTEI
jgi:hypothetical protein